LFGFEVTTTNQPTNQMQQDQLIAFGISIISASISKSISAPFDRCLLLIQTQDANVLVRSAQVNRFKGYLDCLFRLKAEQGLKSLWRGNVVGIVSHIPSSLMRPFAKDLILSILPQYSSRQEFGKYLLSQMGSGALGALICVGVSYPFTIIRNRLAMDMSLSKQEFKGAMDCLKKITNGPNGWLGLYKGMGVSVIGVIPYRGCYLGMYEVFRDMNPWKKETGSAAIVSRFVFAQMTTLTAACVSYPFTVVCHRLQMQSDKNKENRVYSGALNCFTKTMKEEGLRGLYKGFSMQLFLSISPALVLVAYDSLMRSINS
jgi:solute carrier family 25 (mitochondrial adenine nucleotide translocator), member 4/5/6/31